jgi:hypothetical protein
MVADVEVIFAVPKGIAESDGKGAVRAKGKNLPIVVDSERVFFGLLATSNGF